MLVPVCILGCGRSGTSILGELFQDIVAYRYLSEPQLDSLYQLDFNQPVAIKVPRPGNRSASAGLPFLWPECKEILPPNTFWIWQVRHPIRCNLLLKSGY